MAKKPKDQVTGAKRENDNWGMGQNAAGEIVTYTPEEAGKLLAQRNADEKAFGALLDED